MRKIAIKNCFFRRHTKNHTPKISHKMLKNLKTRNCDKIISFSFEPIIVRLQINIKIIFLNHSLYSEKPDKPHSKYSEAEIETILINLITKKSKIDLTKKNQILREVLQNFCSNCFAM